MHLVQAAAVPKCPDVLRLGRLPGVTTLATATRPQAIWLGPPPLSGERPVAVTLAAAAQYTAWLGGDWYGRSSISVDGHEVGALVHARIGTLIYGAAEPKTGAVSSTMKLLDDPSWNHRLVVVAGVMADDSRALLQEFFRDRR